LLIAILNTCNTSISLKQRKSFLAVDFRHRPHLPCHLLIHALADI
jgi:hypothetical protein